MIFLFGFRSPKIGNQYKLRDCECKNCSQTNTLLGYSKASYFHLFFIPIIPLPKSHYAKCEHCGKDYSYREFSPEMKSRFDGLYELLPNKRPIWHGIGCLTIFFIFFFILIMTGISYYKNKDTKPDKRETFLNEDLKKMIVNPTYEKDSTSYMVKQCIDLSIVEEMDSESFKYYSKTNGNKVLILVDIENIKKVEPSSRKQIIETIQECLQTQESYSDKELYIGIDGRWNMVLVSTPQGSDLGGKFANSKLLYPFYAESEMQSVK